MHTGSYQGTYGAKKIWIDLDNSPHVPFFVPIIKELENRNYSVIITGRDAFQVVELVKLFHLQCKTIGRHYGKHKIFKVAGSCFRALQLMFAVAGRKPDLALSHGSRSQILAARLLRIPSILILDYEFASQLAFLGPSWVMAPETIPASAIRFHKEKILKYPGIKEDVYAAQFKPEPSIKTALRLSENHIVVIVRPPANEAHYHNPESDMLFHAVIEFLGTKPEVQVVLLPRTEKQGREARNLWPDLFASGRILIPNHVVDGLNLLWFSDLAISGGGTMNREAAALGVPVYSIFRGEIGAVDRYLSETNRLVLLNSVADVKTRINLVRRIRPEKPTRAHAAALETIVERVVAVIESARPQPHPGTH